MAKWPEIHSTINRLVGAKVCPQQVDTSSMHLENLHALIQHHVLEVLYACGGNKSQTAVRLRISRSSLYRLLDMTRAQPPSKPDPLPATRH
jgi:DNA-binding NtrC family response regulator